MDSKTNNNISSNGQFITPDGLEKLKKELDYLKNIKRHEIAERIEKAKELGDLSENAEYSEAKDEQAFNEGRIIEIISLLKKLTVVASNGNKEIVDLGSKVLVECLSAPVGNGRQKEFIIVSFNEVDPENNKISNESPLGQALIGKKAGDEVSAMCPSGKVSYKILRVE